jgi:hypothetical protein
VPDVDGNDKLNGQVLEVEVGSLSDSISELKARLAEVIGLGANKQKLIRCALLTTSHTHTHTHTHTNTISYTFTHDLIYKCTWARTYSKKHTRIISSTYSILFPE